MNRITRRVTVRFFSIKAVASYFDDLITIQKTNQLTDNAVRMLNIRDKKYLIKLHQNSQQKNVESFCLSVVRERMTWQTRALRNGTIGAVPNKQGIIGDPYYFILVPSSRIIAGFTTGPSGSLKSVATSTLQQFNKDRSTKVALEHISKKKEFKRLEKLSGFNKLSLRVAAAAIRDAADEAPAILKELGRSPFFLGDSWISWSVNNICDEGFSVENLLDIVDFFAEHEGCSSLTVQGTDPDGSRVDLDFGNAYFVYRKQLDLRESFIGEDTAQDVLNEALDYFDITSITDE